MNKIYVIFILGLLVSACASDDESLNLPAENLYNMAYDNLQETKYKKAAEQFEQLETQHPYSKWAVKAKLMAAYAYYKNESYDDAIMAADRFLKYHPGNKDADYAYYLKGMSYYDQISSAEKDQLNTQKAEETFQRLVMLYPDSKYTKDVLQKINLAEDYKAAQEMIIGRYYLNNKNYLSALNRFNVVLEQYQKTVQIEEALYREVEIYAILGMNKYADGYYKILRINYPNGEWTEKAEKVINKIEKNKKPESSLAEINDTSSDSSWYKFGWPWFGDENANNSAQNLAVIEEKIEPEDIVVEEKVEEVSEQKISDDKEKPWYKFGWPWFGDENANNSAQNLAVIEEKIEPEDIVVEEKVAEEVSEQKVSDDKEKPWYKFGWPWFENKEEKPTENDKDNSTLIKRFNLGWSRLEDNTETEPEFDENKGSI